MNPNQQEEDTDYDEFSEWRSPGAIVDDSAQDTSDGEDFDEFAEWRTAGGEPDVSETAEWEAPRAEKKAAKKKEHTNAEILKDVAKQSGKEFLIGIGGAYGDLAELAGVNEQKQSDKEKNAGDFAILQRMNEPGYKPSFADIDAISNSDSLLPSTQQLPSAKGLREMSDALGGPGEAETWQGRYAGRTARIYGSGLAFGQRNPIPSAVAGVAGQTVEEIDGGPLAQAAAEIIGLLLTPVGGIKKLGTVGSKAVKDRVNALRKLGYTDEDITLAINSASKGKVGPLKATKGTKTEQAFENFSERSNDMVHDILQKEIVGYEQGSKHVHELASEAYGEFQKQAGNIKFKNVEPLFETVHNALEDVKQAISHLHDSKPVIEELTKHTLDIISNPTGKNVVDFYKKLNGLGKWVGRNQKDRILKNVKESIKDTFRSEGKQGAELAEKFEKVNAGIQKAYAAERVAKVMKKATTQDGIDFKKLYKQFDNKDNAQLFEQVLGKESAGNLRQITREAKQIKDFDKSWKDVAIYGGSNLSVGLNVGYLLYSGNFVGLSALKGLEHGGRKIAEQMLTNPKFQDLYLRAIHAIKTESPRAFHSANEALLKYLDDEGIPIGQAGKS